MDKKQKILLIAISVIILLIILLVLIVVINKDDNNGNDIINIDNLLVEKQVWMCYESYFYLADGTKNLFDSNGLIFKFSDEYVDRCINNLCKKFTYRIQNDLLIIDNLNMINERYKIKYENDILFLEENNSDGTKIVYYLSPSVG